MRSLRQWLETRVYIRKGLARETPIDGDGDSPVGLSTIVV